MSKFVKQLVTDQLKKRLEGVKYAMLVSLVGITAKKNHTLRSTLAAKGIEMQVIKNSLAARATEGTELAAGFKGLDGACAVCWGATDVVALAKELVKLSKDKTLKGFAVKAAVIDGDAYNAEEAVKVSDWLTRDEQISVLVGQIVSVGSKLSSQFISVGGALASQIKQKSEEAEKSVEAESAE